MDSENTTVNEFLEEYKDFSLNEMRPCLDVLFDAYKYEKEQLGVVDTITAEEYENLSKQYKINRTMALKLKTSTTCCVCGKNLVYTMDNGVKEKITLFGCGHAAHHHCVTEDACPVQGCWDDVKAKKDNTRSRSMSTHVGSVDKSSKPVYSESAPQGRSIEDLMSNLDSGEFSGSALELDVAAPRPSAIYRRKWLLKAVNMHSSLDMDIDI